VIPVIGIATTCVVVVWLVFISSSHRLYPYSAEWDKKLNELMDSHKFVRVDDFTVMIGDVEVWIENKPYADFKPYNPHLNVSPSRKTLRRARARLVQDQLEEVK